MYASLTTLRYIVRSGDVILGTAFLSEGMLSFFLGGLEGGRLVFSLVRNKVCVCLCWCEFRVEEGQIITAD